MAKKILVLEPFYGGSHKQLIDYLVKEVFEKNELLYSHELYTLPSKKWHWRARTSALYFSEKVPESSNFDVLFCSSVLSLAELLGLRPDLAKIPQKLVYFHENQLVYPVRDEKERDFQYGYNQITTALAADWVIFNSNFNKESFLDNIGKHLNLQPDFRPSKAAIRSRIERKSRVIYFPISIPEEFLISHENECLREKLATAKLENGVTSEIGDGDKVELKGDVLRIVWPHRWEHDKNPEEFFRVLLRLRDEGCRFQVSVLGEAFSQVPDIFEEAREKLKLLDDKDKDGFNCIRHWGYLPTKADYWLHLAATHVVVSTANHEFFGVSTLEAAVAGCYPLLPNRLVYPELYPKECLYNTEQQLYKKLRNFCARPNSVPDGRKFVFAAEKFASVASEFAQLFSL